MDATAAATEQNAIPRACNVEDIFHDFEARRAGLLRALTDDADDFYKQCHPDKDNLMLYGTPNKYWELKVPEVDSELEDIPTPTLGINFARDGTSKINWIYLTAVHSDSWLLAVASYYAALSGFDQADRERLYNMINDVPTLFEIIRSEEEKKKYAKSPQSSKNNEVSSKVPKDEEDGLDEDEVNGEDGGDQDEGDEEHIGLSSNKKFKRGRY